jgi:Cu/Ag efflux protein CusF
MFKKTTFLFLVAILTLSTGYLAAQYSQPTPTDQQNTAMNTQQLSGVVEKVNLEKKTITVKDAVTNKKTDYSFSDSTMFSKGTESATASSLKKGDKVAFEVDSSNLITTVRITPETENPHK